MKIEDKKVWNQDVFHKLYLMKSVFMIFGKELHYFCIHPGLREKALLGHSNSQQCLSFQSKAFQRTFGSPGFLWVSFSLLTPPLSHRLLPSSLL